MMTGVVLFVSNLWEKSTSKKYISSGESNKNPNHTSTLEKTIVNKVKHAGYEKSKKERSHITERK